MTRAPGPLVAGLVHRRSALLDIFLVLGFFGLALVIGGLFAAGLLARENDRRREAQGHGSHDEEH